MPHDAMQCGHSSRQRRLGSDQPTLPVPRHCRGTQQPADNEIGESVRIIRTPYMILGCMSTNVRGPVCDHAGPVIRHRDQD